MLAIAAAAAQACAGDIAIDDNARLCADTGNARPAAPSVQGPGPDRLDVQATSIDLLASPFADGDGGDRHTATEWEIWLYQRGGGPLVRVWSARVDDPARLTAASLDDGAFEGGAVALGLVPWNDYGVRVRYRDASGACNAWSRWSAQRTFRIDDGSTWVFDDDEIRDVHLTIPPDSWDAIDAEARPPECVPFQRSYYVGAVGFADEQFDGVGVRVKGGCGSARHLDGKASFKVNLGWDDPAAPGCPVDRRVRGLQRLTLNNMVQDASMAHERLGYRFYRAMGVPAPRVAHARLFVNGELWGLYLQQESIDRRFLSRWFDDNQGMLYEGTYWCDLVPDNVPPGTEDTYCIQRKFDSDACDEPDDHEDSRDYELIRELTQQIEAIPDGAFYPAIAELIDFDTFLSHWAADAVLGHWDGYAFEVINNYRIYHDPGTGLWTLIPTGIDQTFGDELDVFAVSGLLARRCLQEDDCRALYVDRVELAVDVFRSLDLGAEAAAIHAQIAPLVAEDPRREVSVGEHDASHEALLEWIEQRPDAVLQRIGR